MTVRLHPHPLRSDIGDELRRSRGGVAGRRLRDHVTNEAYLNFLDGHGATIDPTNLFSFNRAIPTG